MNESSAAFVPGPTGIQMVYAISVNTIAAFGLLLNFLLIFVTVREKYVKIFKKYE
jgi:hypothetical protein